MVDLNDTDIVNSLDNQSCVLSEIAACRKLLESFCSFPNEDLELLSKKSSELLIAFEQCKPEICSVTSSTWQVLYQDLGNILSKKIELSIPLMYAYCKYLLLSFEKEKYLPKLICLLERVIKFSPTISHAWNDLGECYWETGQIQQALHCFHGAVQHDSLSKDGLRNLAIVYRQLEPPGTEQHNENILSSLKFAQRAVDCDKDDGKSWMILGNVLLSQHFHFQESSKSLLKKCIICYRLAENDLKMKKCADLYSNLGTVFICLEDFNSALQCYSQAAQLDPRSDMVKFKLTSIVMTFRSIQNGLDFCINLSNDKVNGFAQKCLMATHIDNFSPMNYAELKTGEGMNSAHCIHLTVLHTIKQEGLISCIAICVDSNSEYVICNLHGIKQHGPLKNADVITILSPFLRIQKIETSCGISINNPWISSHSPKLIRVNGMFIQEQFIVNEYLKIQAYT